MAQPFEIGQDGISLWGVEEIKAQEEKRRLPAPSATVEGEEGDNYFDGLEDQVSSPR